MNTDNTIISAAIEVLRNSDRVRIVADGGGQHRPYPHIKERLQVCQARITGLQTKPFEP